MMGSTGHLSIRQGKRVKVFLPDGTYGIVADQERPFTHEELTDVAKFKEHSDDLARRVDENLKNMS